MVIIRKARDALIIKTINLNLKKEQKYNNNKLNIAEIFKKYNITDNITDIKRWVRNNLRTILYNNPDMHIKINYGDWQGSLTDVYYNSEHNKYIIRVYCQGDSSDSDSADYLNNFLNANNSYKFYDREPNRMPAPRNRSKHLSINFHNYNILRASPVLP